MLELLAGELGERLLQEAMMGIGEEQLDRSRRGLLLTMGMIEQHLVEVCFGAGEPVGGGFASQVQHGRGV